MPKETLYQYGSKPKPLYYQVVYQGEIMFTDECYSICNSFVFQNQLMGARPKPVYPK